MILLSLSWGQGEDAGMAWKDWDFSCLPFDIVPITGENERNTNFHTD